MSHELRPQQPLPEQEAVGAQDGIEPCMQKYRLVVQLGANGRRWVVKEQDPRLAWIEEAPLVIDG